MILLIDNYDSFTYNLVDYFEQLGVEVLVKRNDHSPEDFDGYDIQAVVISPGPENPYKANHLMAIVERFLGHLPVLGICLGHQAIAMALGASLVKARRPMHGMISNISATGEILFKDLPAHFDVVRYHSLLIENLPDGVHQVAQTADDELMAFEAPQHLAAGLQFHPEAILTDYGMDILRNWLTFYNIV